MRKAAVLGWPIKHSLSPRLHNFWLKQLGIEGSYEAIEVEPAALAATIKSLPAKGFRGFNLTIPHKEAVIPLLDEVDETAALVGAVNCVIVSGNRLKGMNTDAFGFMQNIKQQARLAAKKKAVILGAGGAARAVCKALVDEGFRNILIINRTLEKAELLAAQSGKQFSAVPWEKRAASLIGADLLVNCTSLGMDNKPPLEIDLTELPKKAIVNDIVYAPLMTPLLAEAKARGNKTVDGLGMLIWQAVPAFKAWFGKTPKVTDELKTMLQGNP